MQLAAYLTLAKLTYAEMAEKLTEANPLVPRPAPSTVMRHAKGSIRPGPEMVDAYVKATSGAVTDRDFHELALERSRKSTEEKEPTP